MKNAKSRTEKDRDIAAEYSFAGGVRGKYARRYAQGTNLVLLAPDVARMFPDSESVNRALRACGELVSTLTPKRRKAGD